MGCWVGKGRAEQAEYQPSAGQAEPWPPCLSLPGPEGPALLVTITGERTQSPQAKKTRPCPFRLVTQQPVGRETTLERQQKVKMCGVGHNLPQQAKQRRQPLGQRAAGSACVPDSAEPRGGPEAACRVPSPYLCSGPATAAWGTWFSTVTLEERGATGAHQTSPWLPES